MRLLAIIGVLAIIGAVAAGSLFLRRILQHRRNRAGSRDRRLGARQRAPGRDRPPRQRYAARHAQRCRHGPRRRTRLRRTRLRQLPWRARCHLGEVLRGPEPRAARPQGGGWGASAARAVLDRQERHQDDRHAEFRRRRRARPGNLVDRRIPEEAADGHGRGLQGLEHIGALTGAAARSHRNSETGKAEPDACRRSRNSAACASLSIRMTVGRRMLTFWGVALRRSSSSIAPADRPNSGPTTASVCEN